MDFFRQPHAKDTLGWSGPATVADISRASRGVITLKFNNRYTEVALQNLCRHLHFLVYLAAHRPGDPGQNIVQYLKTQAEGLAVGSWIAVSHSSGGNKYPGLFEAAKFWAENNLGLP